MKIIAALVAASTLALFSSTAAAHTFHIRVLNRAHYPRLAQIEQSIVRHHPRVRFLTAAQAYGKTYAQAWPIWLETPGWLRAYHESSYFAYVAMSYWPDSMQPWPYGIVRADRSSYTITSNRLSAAVTKMLAADRAVRHG